jgi:predicted transcriptional regulator of viral defense system
MNARSFFNQHLVFRFNEFKAYMEGREEGVTEKNCYMTLYNYCKKGKLIHVRKGLYAVVSDYLYDTKTIHPFLIAGKATDDAILAYHTALESHGIAYTDFNEHTYLTKRRTNDFLFQNQRYRTIYLPSLSKINKRVETIIVEGVTLRRTDLERTLVDVLDRPNLSGGWEEVIRSLDRITRFNAVQAIDYALSLQRASIVAKLGYFLEHQRPDYLHIDSSLLERMLLHIPKRPYYIERKSSVGQGTYIKKWKIIVPDYLHYRQWEEPEHDINN